METVMVPFTHPDGKTSQETRQLAEGGQRIRWTLEAGTHLGNGRDEKIVREGTVVGYTRYEDWGGNVGGTLMRCVEEPRKFPDQTTDFFVPVSSDAWETIS